MKRGVVERDLDVSGVTGTGSVATFVINDDGRTVVFWPVGEGIWPTLEAAIEVHGHNGKTRFVILDDPEIEDTPHCEDCHLVANGNSHKLQCLAHYACPGCLETV